MIARVAADSRRPHPSREQAQSRLCWGVSVAIHGESEGARRFSDDDE